MNCRICDSPIDSRSSNVEHLRNIQLCFFCDFWWVKIYWRANGDITPEGNRVARIRHNHYTIHPASSFGPQGFGGRKFVIKFDSGEEVICRNLWHQGEIPQRFREHLPNNAVFVDTRLTCKCRAKFEPITDTQTMCITCVLAKKPQRW